MPGTTLGLLLLIAASGALHIHAEYKGPRRRVYLFKPLTMLLIIGLAYINPAGSGGFYRSAILLGLAISLVGDIFLMLPGNRLLAGLASFFAAHLVYITAFATGRTTDITYLSAIPFYLYALVYYVAISPRLDRLRYPVLAYVIVIATMAWMAYERWAWLGTRPAVLALTGSMFFLVSDSVLGVHRFARPFWAAQLIILSTYYVAQTLIALST